MEGTPHRLALFLSGPICPSPEPLSSCELKLGHLLCSHKLALALNFSATLTLLIRASTESKTLMVLGACFPKSKFMLSQRRKRQIPVPGRCQTHLVWLWHGHSPCTGLCSTDRDWTILWEFHTSHQRVRWSPSCACVVSGSGGIFSCKLNKAKQWQTRMIPVCDWPLDVPCVVIPAVRTHKLTLISGRRDDFRNFLSEQPAFPHLEQETSSGFIPPISQVTLQLEFNYRLCLENMPMGTSLKKEASISGHASSTSNGGQAQTSSFWKPMDQVS